MTPADILAAARLSPLSPVVPARGGWIKDWIGPICFRDGEEAAVYTTLHEGALCRLVLCNDGRTFGYTVTSLRLDLRRPEVRDRLVRCGAPAWCRDSVAGMLGWVLGTEVCGIVVLDVNLYLGCLMLRVVAGNDPHLGFVHAPIIALRAGCVLEESDGWYIPLPGGAVGWLPKESA